MDPLKGPRDGQEIPTEQEPKPMVEAGDAFSRLLDGRLDDNPPKPLQDALDDRERQTILRLQDARQRPAAPAPAAPALGPGTGQHQGSDGGDRRPPAPLPMPLHTPWQPLSEHRNPEGMLLPRPRAKAHVPDAQVDPQLLDGLRREGLADPVTGLRDARMTGDVQFSGWTRVLSETGLSATWRSPKDPGGTWQACVLTEARRVIETVAEGTMQIIEERLGVVSVTRRDAPRFEAEL
ncbi:MAG: hypothetical protein ACYCW6_11660 [Candidatus Xenobia bacterium]